MKKPDRIIEFAGIPAVFIVLVIIFFKEVIFSNDIFVLRDLARYFYPLRGYAFGLLKQGILPLWNPYIFCGNPLTATHQTAVFYPVSLIYLIGSFDKAFNNFIYVHFVLAGVFMYLFLADRKISRMAALVGAISFAFSGYMMAVINLLASLGSVVWVPIALWAFFRATDRRSYPYAILTSIFLVLMFLAGEPAVLYAIGFIMLFCGFRQPKILAVIFTTFLLLSSFQMLPFIELLMRSYRGNICYDIATKWSVPPHDLLNLAFPSVTEIEGHFRGYWDKQSWLLDYYMGLLPLLMLPISAVFVKGRDKRIAFWILAASVILVLGRYTPVYRVLFDRLPTFKLSRYPVKYFFLTTFSLSWLCALGYDAYLKKTRARDEGFARFIRRYLYIALFVGILVLFLDTFFRGVGQVSYKTFLEKIDSSFKDKSSSLPLLTLSLFTIRRTLVFFLIFTLTLFLGTKRRIKTGWMSFAIIGLVIGDLYSSNYDINFHYDRAKFKEPTENIEILMKDKAAFRFMQSPAALNFICKPTENICTNLLKGGKEMLYANHMMEFGLYDVFGYESIDRKRMSDVFSMLASEAKGPDDTEMIDLLNVKYVVSPKIFEAKGYALIRKSDIGNLYENKNVLPRAFLSEKAVVLKEPKALHDKLIDRNWDPRREVVLEEEPILSKQQTGNPPGLSARRAGGRGQGTVAISDKRSTINESADIVKYAPNEVIIKASVNSPKFLVLSDSYYPGWKVYVDERPDKIYVADYIIRAVYLDKGEHTVRFVFDPFSFRLGLWISLSTAIFLAAWFAYKKIS